jgi:hypothetical protein
MRLSASIKRIIAEASSKELANEAWAIQAKQYNSLDREDRDQMFADLESLAGFLEEYGILKHNNEMVAICCLATLHHHLCVKDCNGALSDSERGKISDVESAIAAFFVDTSVGVKFQYDPRGITTCLVLPDGRFNSWDGETWRFPIPTS